MRMNEPITPVDATSSRVTATWFLVHWSVPHYCHLNQRVSSPFPFHITTLVTVVIGI